MPAEGSATVNQEIVVRNLFIRYFFVVFCMSGRGFFSSYWFCKGTLVSIALHVTSKSPLFFVHLHLLDV